MKKKAIGICICLALCIVSMPAFSTIVHASNLSNITSPGIEDKLKKIDQAQKEKENFQNNLNNIKKIKEELENEKSNLKNYVTELDGKLELIEQNISQLKQSIIAKEEEIAITEAELNEAQAIEDNQYESLCQRIKYIYEQGDTFLWEVILNAENFTDLLNKADYVSSIYAYDNKKWKEYQENKEFIELCKQQLELDKDVLDLQKQEVENQQSYVENLIHDKNQEITRCETNITDKEQAIKEFEAEIAEQNEIIATLEAAVAEEKKRILAQSGAVLTYDGGVFKFPLASYTRISDDYGMRTHPILGIQHLHNGVDFAAPKGTAIYSAYDGIVVAATYSATMGNYVMIDHGDSLYTIYMHASALYVSKDDVVARGDTIAAVGSTGRSTGNHLHFSVRLNGSYVSPWNYLSE